MKDRLLQNVVGMVKSLCIAFVISLLLLVILAFMLWKFEIGDAVVNGGIIFTYIFSCFIGAILFVGRKKLVEGKVEKRYLWGILFGAIYFVVVAGISMVMNKQLITAIPGMLSLFFLCVAGGMLGGMLYSGEKRR